MKEHPIISSPEMVRAILAGPKTLTRRVVKEIALKKFLANRAKEDWPMPDGVEPMEVFKEFWDDYALEDDSKLTKGAQKLKQELLAMCPYGQPGDLLWVRHAFYGSYGDRNNYQIWDEFTETIRWPNGQEIKNAKPLVETSSFWKKKPSIHMPKWAARIWLKVLNVRVERLQDITDKDIKAEGIDLFDLYCRDNFYGKHPVKNPSFLHWISGPEGQSGESFCEKCAEKEAKKEGEEWCVDGGWDGGEEDGPRFCDKCGDMLDVNFSDYGVEQEIEHFENNPVRDSIDVSSIISVLSTTNNWDSTHPELAPKLRRICFRGLWDSINGNKYPWESNPWVWVVEFEKIKK